MLPFSLLLSFCHAVFPCISTQVLAFVLNIYNNWWKLKQKIHHLPERRDTEKLFSVYQVDHINMLVTSTTVSCWSSILYFKLRNLV